MDHDLTSNLPVPLSSRTVEWLRATLKDLFPNGSDGQISAAIRNGAALAHPSKKRDSVLYAVMNQMPDY